MKDKIWSSSLLFAVLLSMRLGRFLGMPSRVKRMSHRGVSMMRGLLVMSGLVVLGGF